MRKWLLVIPVMIFCSNAWAAWSNVYGLRHSGNMVCVTSYDTDVSNQLSQGDTVTPGCTINIPEGNAVPVTGNYSVVLYLTDKPGDTTTKGLGSATSNAQHIEAGKQLSELSLSWSGQNLSNNVVHPYMCYVLQNKDTWKVYLFNELSSGCTIANGSEPLPPGPNFLKCTFNDGNALNVPMGEIARSDIGTVPGTLKPTEKNLDVNCTGDGSVTYSIRFQYTAINISGSALITTSSNGLGVAMSLNDTLVNNVDTYTRTYGVGLQTETLKFEPIRDPVVKMSDIPTGNFTASAVMVITVE